MTSLKPLRALKSLAFLKPLAFTSRMRSHSLPKHDVKSASPISQEEQLAIVLAYLQDEDYNKLNTGTKRGYEHSAKLYYGT